MRVIHALITIVLIAAVAAPSAMAAGSNAPPGAAGIDQYLETIPDGSGNKPPGSNGQRPVLADPTVAARAKVVLGTHALRTFKKAGTAGAAVAALAASSAPAVTGDGASAPPSADDGNAFDAVASVVTGDTDSGLGILLPLLLVLSVVVLVGIALLARGRKGSEEPR